MSLEAICGRAGKFQVLGIAFDASPVCRATRGQVPESAPPGRLGVVPGRSVRYTTRAYATERQDRADAAPGELAAAARYKSLSAADCRDIGPPSGSSKGATREGSPANTVDATRGTWVWPAWPRARRVRMLCTRCARPGHKILSRPGVPARALSQILCQVCHGRYCCNLLFVMTKICPVKYVRES